MQLWLQAKYASVSSEAMQCFINYDQKTPTVS